MRYLNCGVLLFLLTLGANAAPPVLFFTDMIDGAKNGGENDKGSYVTIYGKNFGATRGTSTVTINGGAVASYPVWGGVGYRGMEKIVVQLGPLVSTGQLVVTVASVPSNGLAFTVNTWSATSDRSFCVDSSGSDSNNGQFLTDPQTLAGTKGCVLTGRKAKGIANKPGDKVYFGAINPAWQSETGADNCVGGNSLGKNILLSTTCSAGFKATSGTSGHSVGFVAYPGASPSIGSNTALDSYPVYGLAAMGSPPQWWVVSGFSLIAGSCTLTGTVCTGHETFGGNAGFIGGGFGVVFKNWRLIGNEMECPFGDSSGNGCVGMTINHTGAVEGDPTTVYMLGNRFRNYKAGVPTDHQGWRHTLAVYLGTDSNELEFAWNEIDGSLGYSSEALHIHSSPTSGSLDGYLQWGVHTHDNYFHDAPAGSDASFDGSRGSGSDIWNNIMVHHADCFAYPNAGNINVDDSGWNQGFRRNAMFSLGLPGLDFNWRAIKNMNPVRVFNNTIYDVGNCTGVAGAPGLITIINSTGSSATVKPPNVSGFQICGSACLAHQTGTLPATTLSPQYPPGMIGFQVALNSTSVHNVLDDGAGNLIQWMKDGVQQAPPGLTIGTICYDTDNPTVGCVAGHYDFTLQGNTMNIIDTIKYWTLSESPWLFQNNIVYQINKNPEFYINTQGNAISSTLMVGRISGDHNLFYTIGGQTVPPNFTTNIGANTDPLFVVQPTVASIPTNGDFHLQPTSPAIGAGIATTATRDFDGLLRTAPHTVGALAATTGCVPPGVLTTSPLPGGRVSQSYSDQLTASGDSGGTCTGCTWSATVVPSGLTLSSSGLLSGTPLAEGVFNIAVTVTNACGTQPGAPTNFSLTIQSSTGSVGFATVQGKVVIQ